MPLQPVLQQQPRHWPQRTRGPSGSINIVTASVTSWVSFNKWFEASSGDQNIDIFMLQELRLPEQSLFEAQACCRHKGYGAAFGPSITTVKGGLSAGVAILWKSHWACMQKPTMLQEAKALEVVLEMGVVGLLHCYSVYGFVAEQWSSRNLGLYNNIFSKLAHG